MLGRVARNEPHRHEPLALVRDEDAPVAGDVLKRHRAGDTLDLTVKGDEVTLRRGATPLQKERGVWVFRTGEPLTANDPMCATSPSRHTNLPFKSKQAAKP